MGLHVMTKGSKINLADQNPHERLSIDTLLFCVKFPRISSLKVKRLLTLTLILLRNRNDRIYNKFKAKRWKLLTEAMYFRPLSRIFGRDCTCNCFEMT